MQHGAVVEVFDFSERADVPRVQRLGFHGVFALQNERAHHFKGLLRVPGVEFHPGLDRAAVYAEDADFADEGVAHDFEDAGDDGFAGVRGNRDALALGVYEGRSVRLDLRWHVADDDFHEVSKTDHLLGTRKAHRNDVTFAQSLRDGGV